MIKCTECKKEIEEGMEIKVEDDVFCSGKCLLRNKIDEQHICGEIHAHNPKDCNGYDRKIVDVKYLKLVVEWLKLKRMKFICKNGVTHTNTPVVFWSDVEEAFEDVVK